MCFGSPPDRAYAVRGEYQRSAQTLVNANDVPEMPEDYHMMIVWRAIMLLHQHDEAQFNVQMAAANFERLHAGLAMDQLGTPVAGGTLA